MKKSITVLSLFFVLLISSCGKKSVTVPDISPNKKVDIIVNADKSLALDPWKVVISVKAYDFREGQLKFELVTGDVTDKTVHFDWSDDRNCLITFDQSNGEPRKFQLIADSNQVQMGEVH